MKPRLSLPDYHREVLQILKGRHRVPSLKAARLVKKWGVYLLARRAKGVCPESVARHVAKFEREKLVKPARDKGFRASGDADNPHPGELYESRAGTRWEVLSATDKRVTVRRAGHRQTGDLVWDKSAIKNSKLRLVTRSQAERAAAADLKLEAMGVGYVRPAGSGGANAPKTFWSSVLGDPDKKRGGSRKPKHGVSRKPVRTWDIQAIVFTKPLFTRRKAMTWASRRGFKAAVSESSRGSARIRVPQTPASRYVRFASKYVAEGVMFVFGKRKAR
jgi:hypothetical protein